MLSILYVSRFETVHTPQPAHLGLQTEASKYKGWSVTGIYLEVKQTSMNAAIILPSTTSIDF